MAVGLEGSPDELLARVRLVTGPPGGELAAAYVRAGGVDILQFELAAQSRRVRVQAPSDRPLPQPDGARPATVLIGIDSDPPVEVTVRDGVAYAAGGDAPWSDARLGDLLRPLEDLAASAPAALRDKAEGLAANDDGYWSCVGTQTVNGAQMGFIVGTVAGAVVGGPAGLAKGGVAGGTGGAIAGFVGGLLTCD
jgi:hypothetical protein